MLALVNARLGSTTQDVSISTIPPQSRPHRMGEMLEVLFPALNRLALQPIDQG
jgi:hypothetical protein